jgi:hypothetical protein
MLYKYLRVMNIQAILYLHERSNKPRNMFTGIINNVILIMHGNINPRTSHKISNKIQLH